MKIKTNFLRIILITITMLPASNVFALEEGSTLTDSLISYWSFDDIDLGFDSYGANQLQNVGQVNSVPGVLNKAAEMISDDNKYFLIQDNIQSALDISGSISISLWIKLKDLERPQIFVHKYHGNDNDRGYNFYWDSPNITACLSEVGSVPNCKTVPYSPEVDTWYHMVFAWDAEKDIGRIYVNGTQVGPDLSYGISSIKNNSQPFMVGSNEYIQTFNGYLDELGIWNRSLTEEEIIQLYNNGEGISLTTEDSYLLYTQVESPYPSEIATADWENDVYAEGKGLLGEDPCGLRISDCGCAITSIVMATRHNGLETSVVNDDVNPKNINNYLNITNGYDSEGSVKWLKAQAYVGNFNSEGKLESRYRYTEKVTTNVMSAIDAALADPNKEVLGYKNGHFVWIPAKDDSEYIVRDPLWYLTETANDQAVPLLVRDYNNQFDSARILTILDEPVEFSGTDIEASVLSDTAELLFQNSVGEKVGYENGVILIDLEHASYGNTEIISIDGLNQNDVTGKSLLVYDAGNEFTIDVVGTDVGEFTLEFLTIDEFGNTQTFTFSGITLPGLSTTFSFNLETGEVVEQEISYEAFLGLVEQELNGYTDQQKKFFLRWTEKIFNKVEEKTITQLLQAIETYKKLLVAKKVDSDVLKNALDLIAE